MAAVTRRKLTPWMIGVGGVNVLATLIAVAWVDRFGRRPLLLTGLVGMTLTYPVLNRARRILWLVTGEDKVGALRRLRDGDPSIPGGRVSREQALVVADAAAAGGGPS